MRMKVLVLDIDGTLTNARKEITKRTKKAVFQAQKMGVTVVLASGRPTVGIYPYMEELQLQQNSGYILSFNGGQILNCKTGEVIYQKELPKTCIPPVYEASKQFDTVILTYDDNSIVTEEPENEFVRKESGINRMPIRKTTDFAKDVTYPVTKCLVVAEGDHLAFVEEKMKDKFGQELNIYRSEPFFLEIMPQNIDKAYSLSILCDHLGCTKEEMMALGDGFNDLSMISFAGLGIAMENAQQAVKEAADEVTASNEEDGVAVAIETYILKDTSCENAHLTERKFIAMQSAQAQRGATHIL